MAENIPVYLIHGEEENALSSMIFDLINSNLKEKPQLINELENINNLSLGISAKDEDSEVSISLNFYCGNLYIHPCFQKKNDIQISGGYEDILNLTRIPLFMGFPIIPSSELFDVIKKFLTLKTKIIVKNIFVNPYNILRALRIINVL